MQVGGVWVGKTKIGSLGCGRATSHASEGFFSRRTGEKHEESVWANMLFWFCLLLAHSNSGARRCGDH